MSTINFLEAPGTSLSSSSILNDFSTGTSFSGTAPGGSTAMIVTSNAPTSVVTGITPATGKTVIEDFYSGPANDVGATAQGVAGGSGTVGIAVFQVDNGVVTNLCLISNANGVNPTTNFCSITPSATGHLYIALADQGGGTGGNSQTFTNLQAEIPSAVPEPATSALFGVAALLTLASSKVRRSMINLIRPHRTTSPSVA